MDNFDDFFDDKRAGGGGKTPIYHTPAPKRSQSNVALILCIVLAVVMSLVVIVNVIVLATLKDSIASEYAQNMSAEMQNKYDAAIGDALKDKNIVDDVTNAATNEALNSLRSNIGAIGASLAKSVARIYMYKSSYANVSKDTPDSVATAFLITDSVNGSARYLATNAHCVSYVKTTTTTSILGNVTRYDWADYGKIVCYFENEVNVFEATVVDKGGYTDSDYDIEPYNDLPDLALLRIKGRQPSNEDHPSLEIASDDYTERGAAVALIGNPIAGDHESVAMLNSVTTGCISRTNITISSWGTGTFLLTDAAVNRGNSGGPMINSRGVVVGVVESKLIGNDVDNMGFALSAKTLKDFIKWVETRYSIQIDCVYNYGL